MKKRCGNQFKRGVSLIEFMIVASLIGVILSGVYLIWSSMAKSWMSESIKINLNQELQVAISQIKKEMRLSSGNEIFYYPPGASIYDAVSLPIAEDTDDDNLIEMDADENILWTETVVYHTYTEGGLNQLRKTVFFPRDNDLSSSERMEQLEAVVTNGNGASTYNGSNASTKILFNSLDSFDITPALVTLDGYSMVLERTNFVQFGSVVLTPGTHTLRFEVTGKNALSSDYHFAIDALVFSPSGGKKEAEELLPASDSSGQTVQNIDLSAIGSWSGHAHLLYQGAAVGDYIELDIYHDEWIETNFDDQDAEQDGVVFNFDSSLSVPEVILTLDGMRETWEAESQTQGGISQAYIPSPPTLPALEGMTFRTIISGSSLQSRGERIRVLFRANPSSNNLHIQSAYIEERISGQDGSGATQVQLFFNNASELIGTEQDLESGAIGGGTDNILIPAGREAYSNWVDFPIDLEKDYLVSYYLSETVGNASASYFAAPSGTVNSYYRTGDFASTSAWSGAGTNFEHIVGLVEIQATHPALGGWTSQIYDTKIDDPGYSQIAWTDVVPSGTDTTLYIRSSDSADMIDNPTWQSYSSSPGVISGETGRYVQFKVDLTSDPPYFEAPKLKRVSVRWPGEETVIDVGGYFSKNVDYGTIKLMIDGQELSKSVTVGIDAREEYLQRELNSSITSEIQPRNTSQ